MVINYSTISVKDNIPTKPTANEQKKIDEIDRTIARFIVKQLISNFSIEELNLALPTLLEK